MIWGLDGITTERGKKCTRFTKRILQSFTHESVSFLEGKTEKKSIELKAMWKFNNVLNYIRCTYTVTQCYIVRIKYLELLCVRVLHKIIHNRKSLFESVASFFELLIQILFEQD